MEKILALRAAVVDCRYHPQINDLTAVDIESGYGHTPEAIAGNIIKLTNLGVVGINIEDSIVKGERQLCDKVVFAKRRRKYERNCAMQAVKSLLTSEVTPIYSMSSSRKY